MADLQEKYAIKMEKYCFFVPEDCQQMRITLKRKRPKENIVCLNQIQFFNYFSHIQNNEK